MTDEGGVLGNLPNSRPGKRSAKRDRPAKAAEKAAVKAEASGTAAAKPARGTKAKRGGTKAKRGGTKPGPSATAKPGRAAAGAASPRERTTAVKGGDSGDGVRVMHDMDAQRRHDSPGTPGDPLSAAVRTAAGLAVTGVKVGGAVTKELLRRLPRP
jgi:hypothetical protein